jgi:lysophospholipase L1-like esterase
VRLAIASAALVAIVLAGIAAGDAAAASAEPGPIFSSRHQVTILGDSYSAGEGADVYLPGTDTDANPCHRSLHTYLVDALHISAARIVACSGAVANDIHFSQQERTVASQVEQLKRIREHDGVDAVVLTLGGNDAGFATVASSCIVGRTSCARHIYTDPLELARVPSDVFVDERLDALPGALKAAYLAINYVVNGPEARAKGGPVPILVLAYPIATPPRPEPCRQMYGLLSGNEIGFLNGLAVRLNDTIERTVSEVRGKDGAPIFFVPSTETAFRPDHTLCDRKPYARTVKSFNGAGTELAGASLGAKPDFWHRLADFDPVQALRQASSSESPLGEFRLGLRELCHPNQAGYAAISAAVLRWSRSGEAERATKVLEHAPTATPPPPAALFALGPDLGKLAAGTRPTLHSGVVYPLTLGGFAPGSEVEIAAHSQLRSLGYTTANGEGEIEATAAIPPDLSSGDHTVVVAGVGRDGAVRSVEIPFRIAGGGPSTVLLLLIGFGAGLLVAGGVVALVIKARH